MVCGIVVLMNKSGTLYIVTTPIGNLEDMTIRAIRILKEVNLIACEDTRVTKKLLDHFEIKTPTISYFQHSKLSKIEHLIELLKESKDIALVCDAGTPGISDPGQALIAQIRIMNQRLRIKKNNNQAMKQSNNEIQVIPVPGPSALTAAASVAGMIEKEFYFAGFLPKKKGRQTLFKKLKSLDCPIIIYESANRLEKTLGEIRDYVDQNAEVFIGREITKLYEEYWGGKVCEVLLDLKSHALKGEIVIIVKNSGKHEA